MTTRDRVQGMLLGVGIADALGRPCEGMSHEDVRTTYGRITSYLPAGTSGIGTDDTLLTLAVAEGLLLSGGKPDMATQVQAHIRAFHASVQGWGPTTYGSVRRLTQSVPWRLAGARGGRITGLGNGTCMKITPAALLLHQDIPGAVNFLCELCSMTHQTSVAVSAGLAHAFGLAYCLEADPATFNPGDFVEVVVNASRQGRAYFPETLTDDISERLALCHDFAEWPPERCVDEMEGGRCYVYCSLPFSYFFFLRNPRSVEALFEVVSCGGDADTNGSMVGALLGALNGTPVFPAHLVDELEARDRLMDVANGLCDVFNIADAMPNRRVLRVDQADVVQAFCDHDFVISEYLFGGLLFQVANRQYRYVTGTTVTAPQATALADAIVKIKETAGWKLARAINGDATGEGIGHFCVWLRRGAFEIEEDRGNVAGKS